MTTYTFGVMSNKFTLETDNDDYAKVGMCLFIARDIPIAIYSPIKYAFRPLQILKDPKYKHMNPEKIKKILKSVKRLQ